MEGMGGPPLEQRTTGSGDTGRSGRPPKWAENRIKGLGAVIER